MPIQLSEKDRAWIREQTQRPSVKTLALVSPPLDDLWNYLKLSEEKLNKRNAGIAYEQDDSGNPEFGQVLYAMHHLIDEQSKQKFLELGLPPTDLTVAEGEHKIDAEGLVIELPGEREGVLYYDFPFANLDINFVIAGMAEVLRKAGLMPTADFIRTPPEVKPELTKTGLQIAIIGDWGTGPWIDGKSDAPATLVARAVRALDPKPDIVVHLGDVYYAGRIKEEQDRLLTDFPGDENGYNFTLNSNHEMYSGGEGYFKCALASSFFKKQNNSSYFAIRFKPWVIIGLDSAYFDNSAMVSKGSLGGTQNHTQRDFITQLNIQLDERIIVMTHHPAIDFDGHVVLPLFDELQDILNCSPDYWYYGHLHNGIVYNNLSAIGAPQYATRTDEYPKLRCIGHSAIPFGQAKFLQPSYIAYHAKPPYPPNTSAHSDMRCLNGFATISLYENRLVETFFEVPPVGSAIQRASYTWPI